MNNNSDLNSTSSDEEHIVQQHLTSNFSIENNSQDFNTNNDNIYNRYALITKAFKVFITVFLIIIILTCIILLFIPNSPLISAIYSTFSWIDGIPRFWGAIIIDVSYAIGLLLFLPATPFDLVCGLLFGMWLGTLITSLGSICGAIIAFFLGRTLLRKWAENATKHRPTLLALDRAVEQQAFKLVFLSRVSPLLPYPLLNYFFGVTKVKWTTYIIATYLGILPSTFVNCYFGSMLRNINEVFENASDNSGQIILMIVGAVLTVVVLVLVTLITRRALNQALAEQRALIEEDPKEEEVEIGENDDDNDDVYLEMKDQDMISEDSGELYIQEPQTSKQ
eukprot:gb/GECH01004771.1/.p1 GENE.gb/GECH01004771.1/~~gb/GECH01004771.1/.p1  ORF type:complete len:336 (+),score=65.73 gb/GECH01004771.1/:1-1008(+)